MLTQEWPAGTSAIALTQFLLCNPQMAGKCASQSVLNLSMLPIAALYLSNSCQTCTLADKWARAPHLPSR